MEKMFYLHNYLLMRHKLEGIHIKFLSEKSH